MLTRVIEQKLIQAVYYRALNKRTYHNFWLQARLKFFLLFLAIKWLKLLSFQSLMKF